jgi:hypothetical protein
MLTAQLAAGSLINFGLMYNCKLVATEMRALYLRVNAVHFWTSYEGKDSITSQALDSRLRHHFVLLCAILREARAFIDDDVVRYVRETHPPFSPHVEQLRIVRRNYTLQLDIWGGSSFRPSRPRLWDSTIHVTWTEFCLIGGIDA